MKVVFSLLAAALIISSGIMFFLVKKGAALRPAGVIQPAEFTDKPDLIGKAIALRLFPEFQPAKIVIWYSDMKDQPHSQIPEVTLSYYQTNDKPELIDLRQDPAGECRLESCWYIQSLATPLPEALLEKVKTVPSIEIYIQYFSRDEKVSEICDSEKVLELNCIGPVSVREVRKKIKNPGPYFFMRRYLDSQFYLFIEKAL